MGEGCDKMNGRGGGARTDSTEIASFCSLLFPGHDTRHIQMHSISLSKCCQPHSIQAERMAENLRGSPNSLLVNRTEA